MKPYTRAGESTVSGSHLSPSITWVSPTDPRHVLRLGGKPNSGPDTTLGGFKA